MSSKVMSQVWKWEFTRQELAVVLCLAADIDIASPGETAILDVESIVWRTGMRPRKVRSTIAALRDRGVIERFAGAVYRVRIEVAPLKAPFVRSVKPPSSLRSMVMALTGGRCWYCGIQATAADHVVSQKDGGSSDRSNLVPSCQPCNSAKGAGSVEDFRRRAQRGVTGVAFSELQIVFLSGLGFDLQPHVFWGERVGIPLPGPADVSGGRGQPS